MSRNGSGVYSKVNTFVSGNPITAAGHNQNWDDIVAELTNSVAADGQTSMTGPLKAASGTVAAPGITFASDPDSGLYRIGSNNVGLAVNGAKVLDVATTGMTVTGDMNATTVKQAGFSLLPVGVTLPYAGTTAPSGYLLCFGQAVSRTTYSALFTILSTTYGVGDGSTTFNLPDLRGRVVAGQDDMGGSSANRLTGVTGSVNGDTLGEAGGAETHTLTTAQLASHNHGISDPGHVHNQRISPSGGAGSMILNQNGSGVLTASAIDTASAVTGISTIAAGSDSAHNNVQPTIILNYIIFAGV